MSCFSQHTNDVDEGVRVAVSNHCLRLISVVSPPGVAVPKSKRQAGGRQFYLACDLKVFLLTLLIFKLLSAARLRERGIDMIAENS